jgi:2-C-methyl-D-erythritol 2,4-cyclodiphosphate synthase
MIRVGIGYDIHQLQIGRKLVLGGVLIPHTSGLAGHSDADVVLHALMDAILGALALGDIGQHFPPSDERFRDVSSVVLLRRVVELMRAEGYAVGNADVMVVAEQPRLSHHIFLMRDVVRKVLEVDIGQVSIKATTNERVGPEGRLEAISAHAVVLLESTS